MTPKEKAEYLKKEFLFMLHDNGAEFVIGSNVGFIAKQCAIVFVNEMDRAFQKNTPPNNAYAYLFQFEYWQEVKEELQKM